MTIFHAGHHHITRAEEDNHRGLGTKLFNHLIFGGKKGHTYLNLQLLAADLFKHVWRFVTTKH